jgi:hypothetical protein
MDLGHLAAAAVAAAGPACLEGAAAVASLCAAAAAADAVSSLCATAAVCHCCWLRQLRLTVLSAELVPPGSPKMLRR